jgi:hypothetical protein
MRQDSLLRSLLMTAVLVTAFGASVLAQDKIPVFVKTAATANGFTDPSKDRQDSVQDLRKKLMDSKAVVPVESAKEALVVLEVLDRETKWEMNLWGPHNRSYLIVRLTAGEYAAEFAGESGSRAMFKGYGAAAGNVVDQLEAWVETNRARLVKKGE